MRQPPGEQPPGQPLRAAGRRPFAHADRHHTGGQQQDVAALQVLQSGAVELLDAGEPRMVGVDGGGDRALPVPRRHGQRGHRHLVAHPHRGVAGEQQVGQRRDDEVAAVHDLVGQAAAAAQLVVRETGDERGRQVLGIQPGQMAGGRPLQGRAQPRVVDRGADELGPRGGEAQDLGEQLVQVEDLDAALGQGCGERVVLLLRPVHPRDAVEEQLVVVPGGESPQLRPGAMQQDGAQPADLAAGPHARTRLDHGQRLTQPAGPPPARTLRPAG